MPVVATGCGSAQRRCTACLSSSDARLRTRGCGRALWGAATATRHGRAGTAVPQDPAFEEKVRSAIIGWTALSKRHGRGYTGTLFSLRVFCVLLCSAAPT